MDLDADIDVILGAFDPVPVVHASGTGVGIRDVVDRDMLQSVTAALGEVDTVTVRTSAFPGMASGDPITVEGVSYKITSRHRIDDGRLTLLILGKP